MTSIEDEIVTGFKTFETVNSLWNVTSKTINGQTLDNFTTDSSPYGHPKKLLLFGSFLFFNYFDLLNHSWFELFLDGIQTNGTVRIQLPITAPGVDEIDLNRQKDEVIPVDTENFPPWPHPFVMTNIMVGPIKIVLKS